MTNKKTELATRSMAGFIRRDQYHDVTDKILKLVVQPVVSGQVCDHDARAEISADRQYWICGKCGTRI